MFDNNLTFKSKFKMNVTFNELWLLLSKAFSLPQKVSLLIELNTATRLIISMNHNEHYMVPSHFAED